MSKEEVAINLVLNESVASPYIGNLETEFLTTGILLIMAIYIFIRFRVTNKIKLESMNNEVNTNIDYMDK